MILYVNRKFQRKLLELINEFSSDAKYIMNTPKAILFLYTSNEQSEKEIKKAILFTIAAKRIKYLGIDLIKKVKNLNTENYNPLLKNLNET